MTLHLQTCSALLNKEYNRYNEFEDTGPESYTVLYGTLV